MSQNHDDPAAAPSNRGDIGISGIVIGTLIFVVLVPLVMCLQLTMVVLLLLYPASILAAYMFGSVPAAITGLAFCLMWRARVPARRRILITAAIAAGVCGGGIIIASAFSSSGPVYAVFVALAAAVAALVSSWVAGRVLSWWEASHPRPASWPAGMR